MSCIEIKKPIFLDNASTTFMSREAFAIYEKYALEKFYNPSAQYKESNEISKDIEKARDFILNRLGAKQGTIIFTSGATESNNLAIRGSLREGAWEYVFSEGEHSSVYNVAKALSNEGKNVKFVALQKNGQIDYDKLDSLINDKTRLVSIIYVSNETGAINNIEKIVKIVKSKNKRALIHVDGVQAFNKIPFSLMNLDIDFLSFSAHKFHGPKGVGALYVKNIEPLKSIVYGGGQEFGKRSGTENVPGIMAMVEACKHIDVEKNLEYVKNLKGILIEYFKDKEDVDVLDLDGSPYIVSLSFKGVNGETLMRALEDEVVIGTGSACGAKTAGNRVLQALGLNHDAIKSSVRVSFDYNNSTEEVKLACDIIYEKYKNIYDRVK